MDGAERIAKERQRQVSEEGYAPGHDDEHGCGELAIAAACYAADCKIYVRNDYANQVHFVDPWPWESHFDKRTHNGNVVTPGKESSAGRIRLLERAGALIAAEIDRLLRAGADKPAKGASKP